VQVKNTAKMFCGFLLVNFFLFLDRLSLSRTHIFLSFNLSGAIFYTNFLFFLHQNFFFFLRQFFFFFFTPQFLFFYTKIFVFLHQFFIHHKFYRPVKFRVKTGTPIYLYSLNCPKSFCSGKD